MSNRQEDDRRNAATMIALFGLLAVSAAIVAVTFMVVPTLAFAVLLGIGFVFLIMFHYIVWGRWLSNRPRPEDDEE